VGEADHHPKPAPGNRGGFFVARSSMAFTSTDSAALKQAIASGERRVRFSDGREVEYRSIGELMQALRTVEAELAAGDGERRPAAIRVRVSKGVF
jgi:hypothetical protein